MTIGHPAAVAANAANVDSLATQNGLLHAKSPCPALQPHRGLSRQASCRESIARMVQKS